MWVGVETGCVVSGVLDEVAMLPVDRQNPRLVALALAAARVMDDPDNAMAWPASFARMTAALDELHEEADE